MTDKLSTAEDLRAAAPGPSLAGTTYLAALDLSARARAQDGYDTASLPVHRWAELGTNDRTAVTRNLEARGFLVGFGPGSVPTIYWGDKEL